MAGQVRVLAVTSPQRSTAMPEVPTLHESGFPGFDVINVIGILAPGATPKPIVYRLTTEIARIMSTGKPRVRDQPPQRRGLRLLGRILRRLPAQG